MLKTTLLLFGLLMHPVHVTLMSIDLGKKDKDAELYLMIYFDDFQRDYMLACGYEFGDESQVKSEDRNQKLLKYLGKRISVVSKDTSELIIKNVTLADNELKIYMTGKNIISRVPITVENSILSDIYPDQSNLVILRYGDFEEGIKLSTGTRKHIFRVK
jgi:hypothetical protein